MAPFFAPLDAPLSPQSTEFPAFSQLAGNLGSETGSLETELLGLKLLPGQEANLRAAYAFAPAPGAERRR